MVDITDRKKAEEALVASEERFRTSLDNMIEGCQIIDRNWRYIYLNDAVLKQSQRKKAEITGRTMMEVYPGIEKQICLPYLKHAWRNGYPTVLKTNFPSPKIKADGSI